MKPKGQLLIIGGKEDKDGSASEMKKMNKNFSHHEILKLLAKSKDDRIEVITAATSEPESMQQTYTKTFKDIGYTNFGFLDIRDDQIHTDDHFKRIKAAATVFFTGGDQNRICQTLQQSVLIDLLREKYQKEENFMIAGTSAGAMCIPNIVILEAVNGEAILENDIELDSGLGLIGNYIIDTHFVHRARFGRLAHAIISHRDCWGIGLGEDTALLIEEGCKATCYGSGMVWIFNAKEIGCTNIETVKKGYPIYAENLKAHILTEGCKIDFSNNVFAGALSEKKNDNKEE
ncbi:MULTISPECIES: cyanophycinase [unclassified Chryseobacterium]|uniref:cyanophycinase n=1 Tax=unclassified Chryseobacterium TaxID=2593645 RepID=UPI001D5B9F2E|nr:MULTISPECIES: cyanophycinase [unclassified Chryseobacterium]MCQ9635673.1 cyanophycinase [Chryseobacterium sp. WG23]CAH0290174.1 Cyanophycinase [Chryseobacterium sp. Bi04]